MFFFSFFFMSYTIVITLHFLEVAQYCVFTSPLHFKGLCKCPHQHQLSFLGALRGRPNCQIVLLSEPLRCLADILSFICAGQEGGQENDVARPHPVGNAGLSGVCY